MDAGRAGRGGTRAGGALAHLLLVVVLALGVFVMHAVGHPEGSSAGDGTSHAAAPTQPGPQHHRGASAQPAPHDSPHSSGMGMDMTTLCVAVLGGWLLAALLRAALRRGAAGFAPLLARLLSCLGPNAPPPRPPDLAHLSILRI
ncbi:DUF6153 family protein [Streptomyces sp. NPDC020422]|uniref:DUF6153 family protein n=1 Tax=Streptomyces sp. NPDC020422 TaxID=3365074 RepID=UPI0037B88EDB